MSIKAGKQSYLLYILDECGSNYNRDQKRINNKMMALWEELPIVSQAVIFNKKY